MNVEAGRSATAPVVDPASAGRCRRRTPFKMVMGMITRSSKKYGEANRNIVIQMGYGINAVVSSPRPHLVIPAKAGIQGLFSKGLWIPAFAGMTKKESLGAENAAGLTLALMCDFFLFTFH